LKLKSKEIPRKDYNPYQYARENFIISCLEVRTEFERNDCENVKEIIEKFYEIDTMEHDKEKIEYIKYISRFQCQETYNFLKTQIKNNPSETVRYNAIIFLAWSLNSDYLPCILEYAKKDSLSTQEKLALGSAFTILGVYTSHSELKEEAIKFLDEICYDFSSDTIPCFDPSMDFVRNGCFWNYYKLGEKAAINYFNVWGEHQKGFKKVTAAVLLAELGEYETTYPIFIEAIHSDIPNYVYEAIRGLAIFGTEEAILLIEEQTQNNNDKIAKYAQETLRKLDKERRKE